MVSPGRPSHNCSFSMAFRRACICFNFSRNNLFTSLTFTTMTSSLSKVAFVGFWIVGGGVEMVIQEEEQEEIEEKVKKHIRELEFLVVAFSMATTRRCLIGFEMGRSDHDSWISGNLKGSGLGIKR
ncbi:hypothetical protein RJT34_29157 [Clitoria ternatea]|uniref:Uncharacterized protein n=1 Tax=Clitoria ternatea TaxID=43366 RepID=A0AAN9IHE6_CLITE